MHRGAIGGLRCKTVKPPVPHSAVLCAALSKLPKIGEGLIVPKNGRFIDLSQEEGEVKVPAGISLQEPGGR